MKISRELVKSLIIMSASVEEADRVIEYNYGFRTVGEKIAFLNGMFDVRLVSKHDGDGVSEEESAKMDYYALLDTIIKNWY